MLLKKNSIITRYAEERTEGCQRTRIFLKQLGWYSKPLRCKKETTTQKTKVFFITNTNATKFTRFIARLGAVLLHKLSYSLPQDYKLYTKTLPICSSSSGGICRPKERCTWNKRTNDKIFKEVTKSSKGKATAREDTILEDNISK
jgi:hypothetical protein